MWRISVVVEEEEKDSLYEGHSHERRHKTHCEVVNTVFGMPHIVVTQRD